MDLMTILQKGSALIQNNSDDATTGLDVGDIGNALSSLLGNKEGGLDLGALIGGLSDSGLSDIVSSWLGSGENASISTDQITELIGSDKISEFASQLGISQESAAAALSDALPEVVDEASSSIAEDLLAKIGGAEGAMNMLGVCRIHPSPTKPKNDKIDII